MITFIIENKPYIPEKVIVISNYVYIEAGNGKFSIGMDKEDLEKWLIKMQEVTLNA